MYVILILGPDGYLNLWSPLNGQTGLPELDRAKSIEVSGAKEKHPPARGPHGDQLPGGIRGTRPEGNGEAAGGETCPETTPTSDRDQDGGEMFH